MATIFVTGATGVLGEGHGRSCLVEEGHHVRALAHATQERGGA